MDLCLSDVPFFTRDESDDDDDDSVSFSSKAEPVCEPSLSSSYPTARKDIAHLQSFDTPLDQSVLILEEKVFIGVIGQDVQPLFEPSSLDLL